MKTAVNHILNNISFSFFFFFFYSALVGEVTAECKMGNLRLDLFDSREEFGFPD
jgi:hypothetical protein